MSPDRRNVDFNLNLERAKQVVCVKVAEIEAMSQSGFASSLLSDKWNSAKGNTDLPIFTYPQALLDAGFSETHIKSVLDLIANLEVDVSDPHTSSSELSVIVGLLSEDLLGIDATNLRRKMDAIKLRPVNISGEPLPPSPPDLIYTGDERALFQDLNRIKKWQRELILSSGNYHEISGRLLEQNNQALAAVTRGRLYQFWMAKGIPEDSRATIYFRDHKTYAGDVDFYYWGPEPERCVLELSRYLMSLGYKVDHRSNILVEDLIRGGQQVDNGYLSAYLQMYFYMGKAIEINGDSFKEHYERDVLPVANPELAWNTSHQSVARASGLVGRAYGVDMPEYPGLKDYPFRLLSVTLMGLATKYNIPFTLNYEGLLSNLRGRLSDEELRVFGNAFYYINQARNIYQLATERRWEMMTPEIKQEIDKILLGQSGRRIEDEMALLSGIIRSVVDTHFGEPENEGILDLNESKDAIATLVAKSYKKVGERYKAMVKL